MMWDINIAEVSGQDAKSEAKRSPNRFLKHGGPLPLEKGELKRDFENLGFQKS